MALSIGERLKSAREAKELTLEQVAKATKVQRKILEAIEENRIDDFLDPVYAKIFIKKYTGYLGIDGSALLEEYSALVEPGPEAPFTPLQRQGTEKPSSTQFRQLLIPLSVCIVGIIGLAFLIHLAIDFTSSFTLNRKHRPTQVAHPVGPLTPSGEKKSEVSKPKEASKPLVPRSQPLKLTIRTKADVWMQIKSDGAVIFQNVLPKGSQESWNAKDELELWTGNAGAVELQLNGKSIGPLGAGVRKGIKVTRRGLEE